MKGSIFYQILESHTSLDTFTAGDIIPLDVDSIFLPDNSARPVFKLLERLHIEKVACPTYLGLTYYSYQLERNYSRQQALIIQNANKYGIKLLPNYKGLWHYHLLSKPTISAGSVLLGSTSTINFFAPLNLLAISSGINDLVYALVEGKIDYVIPTVLHIQLEGKLPKGIGGKDIALFLKKELSHYTQKDNFVLEFSGHLLDQLRQEDLHTLSLHHFSINTAGFIFPPGKKAKSSEKFVFPLTDKYPKEFRYDLSKCPSLIEHQQQVCPVSGLSPINLDKIFIGNSSGGSLRGLERLAKALSGNKVKTECFIIPSSADILTEALKKGYLAPILESGCILLSPSTGICTSTNGIVPIENENILSTGISQLDLGPTSCAVYYGSMDTAIASALTGVITAGTELKNGS